MSQEMTNAGTWQGVGMQAGDDCHSLADFEKHFSWERMQSSADEQPVEWCFRGQQMPWPIQPSAFRRTPPASEFGLPQWRRLAPEFGDLDWAVRQVKAEAWLLWEFVRAAHRACLPLEVDTTILKHPEQMDSNEIAAWPQPGLMPLLQLAQHHGIPTRLIDFSRDWRVAAFFAASGAKLDQAHPITVFALNITALELLNESAGQPIVKIIEPASGSNTFLNQQRGLFVLDENSLSQVAEAQEFWPLERSLGYRCKRHEHWPEGLILMKKITLAPRLGESLRQHLKVSGMSRLLLMPTLDNAAKMIASRV